MTWKVPINDVAAVQSLFSQNRFVISHEVFANDMAELTALVPVTFIDEMTSKVNIVTQGRAKTQFT